MRLQEDKTRFINNLPWSSEEEKSKVLDFFKTHANLESKIQNWQSKDKENLVNEIRDLISETNANSLEREKSKQAYQGNIDWEAHDCRYLGEDENWIYITPISYYGAMFCDSCQSGGAGAKWCIGWMNSDHHWVEYRKQKALFLMKFNKHPNDKQNDLKFMIEGYLGEDKAIIWNQKDKQKRYTLSEREKEYLKTIQRIWDDITRENIAKYFDNPKPGVYVARNEESLKYTEDIGGNLKVFKVKDGATFKSVTSAGGTFRNCSSLTSVDTSVFEKVVLTSEMFRDCKSLTSVDTSVFKKVWYARQMFQGCTSLTSIDTSGFGNVKDASYMFEDCKSLTSINASSFKNVTSAAKMFKGCESLTSIDTSGFVNVTMAAGMFSGCKSLTSIDASVFVSVKHAANMFEGCTSLKTYVPGPNNLVNEELKKIGAKPVKRLRKSPRRKVIEEILEE